MLELLSLTFNNIGRFIEEQTVDFENRGKTIQINGLNNNTGGSSGAAKTTILNTHDYLLGISDIPATILQSRLTKQQMYVQGRYKINGDEIIIKRSKKTGEGLTIVTPNETISGNVKLAEEKLDELIGIPRKLFKKMIHKKQKEGGFFLNMTAKETHEFLVELLGLKQYTDKIDLIDQDLKNITDEVVNLTSQHDTLVSSIDELNSLFDSMKEPVCNISQDQITELKNRVEKYKSDLVTLTNIRDTALSQPVPPVHITYEFDNSITENLQLQYNQKLQEKHKLTEQHSLKLRQLSDAKLKIQTQLNEINNAKNKINDLSEKLKELKSKKDEIQKSICPTCKQTWVGETALIEISRIESSIILLNNDLLKNCNITKNELTVTDNLLRLNQILKSTPTSIDTSEIDKELSEINSQIVIEEAQKMNIKKENENKYLIAQKQYRELLDSINSQYNPEIDIFKAEINTITSELNTKTSLFNMQQKSVEEFIASRSRILKMVSEKDQILKNNIDRRFELSKKLDIASESKRLIKTYTLQIFQETLDAIGELATQTLSSIPNMSTASIYFEGCKENQSGSIRDEVNAILNLDGDNDVPIKSLSGGERTAIDLAVDLAVIDVIESKTSKGANIFIVDEPFTGLEDINIEQCLAVLQQIDTNKKIIIIDHNEKVKEAVSDIITVERNGESSKIIS